MLNGATQYLPQNRAVTRGLPVSFQQRQPQQLGFAENVARALFMPYNMAALIAQGIFDSAKMGKQTLEDTMYRPQTPQSAARQTMMMADIGTPGTSGGKVAGSTLGIFGGREATAGLKMVGGTTGTKYLDEAIAMVKKGTDPEDVRKSTGWTQNPYDKKWRFEIDDSGIKPKKGFQDDLWLGVKDYEAKHGGAVELQDVIEHKELFDAYPRLKNVAVAHQKTPGAQYLGSEGMETIFIGPYTDKQTLIHEIQHAVQEIEGFARGGSPATFGQSELGKRVVDLAKKKINPKIEAARKAGNKTEIDRLRQELYEITSNSESEGYRRLAGEIEAREAAKRMGLSMQERAIQAPFLNAIPVNQAIVRY